MRLVVESVEKVKKKYEIKVRYIDGDKYYPDGKGGQLGDRGNIGDANVLEVKKSSIIIDKALDMMEYDYTINRGRQVDIAAQHTGEHLFSGIAFRDFGMKNVGFRMADEYTTVDLDSNDISLETIEAIEKEINKTIRMGIDVADFTVTREEANEKEELRKEVSDKVEGDIRFIEIPGVDVCACGGFHVKNTKDIQLFKFISWEKVKGNYTRFYFLCGERAIEDYTNKNTIVKEANKMYSSKDHEVLGFIKKNLDDKKELEREIKQLSDEFAKLLSKELISNATEVEGKKIVIYDKNDLVANSLNKYIADEYTLVFGDSGQFTILSSNIDCKEFIGKLREKHSVKGGGNTTRGSVKGDIELLVVVEELKNYLKG